MDSAYAGPPFVLSELSHAYGPRVHVLADPFSLTLLARLCHPTTTQPAFNRWIVTLYRHLFTQVVSHRFPRAHQRSETRMRAVTERGVLEGSWLAPSPEVVSVAIARAGILPSQVCFDLCNELFDPSGIRQDHVTMSREVDSAGKVVGSRFFGEKVGGPIDGKIVIYPDPMGATGKSVATAIRHYREHYGAAPAALLVLHLIVTPQALETLLEADPDVEVYALRLDRGASPDEVLSLQPGEAWGRESGLSDQDYIVPGGGGFGELMNNTEG